MFYRCRIPTSSLVILAIAVLCKPTPWTGMLGRLARGAAQDTVLCGVRRRCQPLFAAQQAVNLSAIGAGPLSAPQKGDVLPTKADWQPSAASMTGAGLPAVGLWYFTSTTAVQQRVAPSRHRVNDQDHSVVIV